VIVDTGILYAAVDRDDAWHTAAKAIFALPDVKVVPEPVIVETDFLVLRRLGVETEIGFLKGLSGRAILVESPTELDRARAVDLIERYRDLEIGYVDAVVVAIAERLKEHRIATVDRRDFQAVRPGHVSGFELLP